MTAASDVCLVGSVRIKRFIHSRSFGIRLSHFYNLQGDINTPLWDEVTAAIAAYPELVTQNLSTYMDVDVSDGPFYGRSYIASNGRLISYTIIYRAKLTCATASKPIDAQPVNLILSIDTDAFYSHLVAAAQGIYNSSS